MLTERVLAFRGKKKRDLDRNLGSTLEGLGLRFWLGSSLGLGLGLGIRVRVGNRVRVRFRVRVTIGVRVRVKV